MPITRNQAELSKSLGRMEESSDPKAGKRNICSVAGSRVSAMSGSSSRSVIPEVAVLRATQLKAQLKLESEQLTIKQKLKLLKAEHDVQTADLLAVLSVKEDESAASSSYSKVVDYLSKCAPPTSSPKNYDVVTPKPVNELDYPLYPGADLPKVELLPFDGKPENY